MLLAVVVSLAPAISDHYLTVASPEAVKIFIKVRYRVILVSTGRVLSCDGLLSPKLCAAGLPCHPHLSEILLSS